MHNKNAINSTSKLCFARRGFVKNLFTKKFGVFFILTCLILPDAAAQIPEQRPTNVYTNPRTMNVSFWWRVIIGKQDEEKKEKRSGFRFGSPQTPTLFTWISRAKTWGEQWATEPTWRGTVPTFTYVDAENNNIIDTWTIENAGEGDTLEVSKQCRITVFETHYDIDPRNVGDYNKSLPLFRQYTRGEDGIEKSGFVRKEARAIVGEERNPYLRAQSLFKWIVENLSYDSELPGFSASQALELRQGDGVQYCLLLVALCRSLDIPARVVSGHWMTGNRGLHVWVEFYIPNYGWVPADPVEADRSNISLVTDDILKRYFGQMGNDSIIISKGTNILLWPRVKGSWLENFGLDEDGRSPMMQIGDYALQSLDVSASYNFTWRFWK